MFKSMDADNSGTITVDELRRGLAKQGTKLSEAEVEQLMEAVSFLSHILISRSTCNSVYISPPTLLGNRKNKRRPTRTGTGRSTTRSSSPRRCT
jgi:hypothetical protein